MTKLKFKHCPFCGGKRSRLVVTLIGLYVRQCCACGATTGIAESASEADARWNARANEKDSK